MKARIKTPPLHLHWLIIFALLSACVDQLNYKLPASKSQTILDGYISTEPGPYTIKLSSSLDTNTDSLFLYPIEKAIIKIFDDQGNSEALVESSPGIYVTGGVMRGQVGHAYHVSVQLENGNQFESTPETIYPAGQLDTIRYIYEARVAQNGFGDLPADVFKIYAGGHSETTLEHYVRWRYTATYMVVTNPELHFIWSEGFILPDPLPCSGWEVQPAVNGGNLIQLRDCTCCTCYVNNYENLPTLSDGQLVNGTEFSSIKVGELEINNITFSKRVVITVEQMSLSKSAFDFFHLLRQQKEGTNSIFQPSFGRIKGNIHALNSSAEITGLFWATDISTKRISLDRTFVSYPIAPMETDFDACTHFKNSSTAKPSFWQ